MPHQANKISSKKISLISISKFLFFIFFASSAILINPLAVHAAVDFTFQIPFPGLSETIQLCSGSGDLMSCSGIAMYIIAVYEWLIKIAIAISVLIIVLAGFRWMFARGDSGAITEARKMIANTFIGLALALGSYVILSIINPQLVAFGPLGLSEVEKTEIEIEKETPVINENFDEISQTSLKDPGTVIARINQLMPLYKQVSQEMNVPWELLAATHYQEAGNRPDKSMFNGFDICNNRDNSRCSYCNQGATPLNDYKCAAKLLHSKARMSGFKKFPRYSYKSAFTLTKDSPIAADPSSAVANVMFRYNGVCPRVNGVCQDITGSAYIMNMLTPAHVNMPFEGRLDSKCKTSQPGCLIKKTWGKRDGALRFILRLKNPANFDASGKLIKMD